MFLLHLYRISNVKFIFLETIVSKRNNEKTFPVYHSFKEVFLWKRQSPWNRGESLRAVHIIFVSERTITCVRPSSWRTIKQLCSDDIGIGGGGSGKLDCPMYTIHDVRSVGRTFFCTIFGRRTTDIRARF